MTHAAAVYTPPRRPKLTALALAEVRAAARRPAGPPDMRPERRPKAAPKSAPLTPARAPETRQGGSATAVGSMGSVGRGAGERERFAELRAGHGWAGKFVGTVV